MNVVRGDVLRATPRAWKSRGRSLGEVGEGTLLQKEKSAIVKHRIASFLNGDYDVLWYQATRRPRGRQARPPETFDAQPFLPQRASSPRPLKPWSLMTWISIPPIPAFCPNHWRWRRQQRRCRRRQRRHQWSSTGLQVSPRR